MKVIHKRDGYVELDGIRRPMPKCFPMTQTWAFTSFLWSRVTCKFCLEKNFSRTPQKKDVQ